MFVLVKEVSCDEGKGEQSNASAYQDQGASLHLVSPVDLTRNKRRWGCLMLVRIGPVDEDGVLRFLS